MGRVAITVSARRVFVCRLEISGPGPGLSSGTLVGTLGGHTFEDVMTAQQSAAEGAGKQPATKDAKEARAELCIGGAKAVVVLTSTNLNGSAPKILETEQNGDAQPKTPTISQSNLEKFCQATRARAQEAKLNASELETLEKFLTLKGQGSWSTLVRQKLSGDKVDLGEGKAQTFAEFCEEARVSPEQILPVHGVTALKTLTGTPWDHARRALKDVAHDDPKVASVIAPLIAKDSPATADGTSPDGTAAKSKTATGVENSDTSGRDSTPGSAPAAGKGAAPKAASGADASDKGTSESPPAAAGNKTSGGSPTAPSPEERREEALNKLHDLISRAVEGGLYSREKANRFFPAMEAHPGDYSLKYIEDACSVLTRRVELWETAKKNLGDHFKGNHRQVKKEIAEALSARDLVRANRSVEARAEAVSIIVQQEKLEYLTPKQSAAKQVRVLTTTDVDAFKKAKPFEEKILAIWQDARGLPIEKQRLVKSDLRSANDLQALEEIGAKVSEAPPASPEEDKKHEEEPLQEGIVGDRDEVELVDWAKVIEASGQPLDLGIPGSSFRVDPDGSCVLSHVGKGVELEVIVDRAALTQFATLDDAKVGLLLKGSEATATDAIDNDYFRNLTLSKEFTVKKLLLDPVAHGTPFKAVGLNLRCAPGAELALDVADSVLKISGKDVLFKTFNPSGSTTMDLDLQNPTFEKYSIGRDVVGVGTVSGAKFVDGKCEGDLVAMNLKGITVQQDFAKAWKGTRFDFAKTSRDLFSEKSTRKCENYLELKSDQNVKAFNNIFVQPDQVARIIRGISGTQVAAKSNLNQEAIDAAMGLAGVKTTDVQFLECSLPAVPAADSLKSVLLVFPSQSNQEAIKAGDLRALGVVVSDGDPSKIEQAFDLNFGKMGKDEPGAVGIQYSLTKYLEFLSLSADERNKKLKEYEVDLVAAQERRARQEEEAALSAAEASKTANGTNPTPPTPAPDASRPDLKADSGVHEVI